MTHFKDLGLAEPILQALMAEGYNTPTPIQNEIIPALLSGADAIGIAQTGTGKTAAFVLPILNEIIKHKGRPEPKGCRALIITPTRELASQIAENAQKYSQFMDASITVIVGGVKPGPQIKACARGVDIIVATPGRLLDHMENGNIRLDRTHMVIADEADQMMDMGFLPSIRKIMKALPRKRQTVLLSATMPTQIRSLAKDFMDKPVEISVAPISRPIERIKQSVQFIEKAGKRGVLNKILSQNSVTRAVVFTRTKHGANKVTKHIIAAGLNAAAIHGNKSQSQREKALEGFRSGRIKILVATDIAARGIDIDDVSHVINFELPNVSESYVHRIGRTARAGRSGIAISLCDTSEVKLLRDIEKLIGSRLEVAVGDSGSPLMEYPEQKQASKAGRNRSNKRFKKHDEKAEVISPYRKNPLPKYNKRSTGQDTATDGLMRMLGEENSRAA